jgi:hypothetical protein
MIPPGGMDFRESILRPLLHMINEDSVFKLALSLAMALAKLGKS